MEYIVKLMEMDQHLFLLANYGLSKVLKITYPLRITQLLCYRIFIYCQVFGTLCFPTLNYYYWKEGGVRGFITIRPSRQEITCIVSHNISKNIYKLFWLPTRSNNIPLFKRNNYSLKFFSSINIINIIFYRIWKPLNCVYCMYWIMGEGVIPINLQSPTQGLLPLYCIQWVMSPIKIQT